MRTTITLEPDVEALVAKAMRERGLTFKQAVNEALRQSLGGGRRTSAPFRTPTRALGMRVDVTKALQLAGELEVEALLHKKELGK